MLLTTPLSAFKIVWGKWWGAYRRIILLSILPLATCLALNVRHGHFVYTALQTFLILGYGAGITSLGLALATWMPKLGRAIAVSVIAYLGVTIVWVMIIALLAGHDSFTEGLLIASPFYGTAITTDSITSQQFRQSWDLLGWDIAWILIYFGFSIVLFLITVLTFERCLGRVSQHSGLRTGWMPRRGDERPCESPGFANAGQPSL